MMLTGLRVAGKGCGWRGMGSKAKIRGLGDQEEVSRQAGAFSLPTYVVRFWEYFGGRAAGSLGRGLRVRIWGCWE